VSKTLKDENKRR
jgi:hypothetical protein